MMDEYIYSSIVAMQVKGEAKILASLIVVSKAFCYSASSAYVRWRGGALR